MTGPLSTCLASTTFDGWLSYDAALDVLPTLSLVTTGAVPSGTTFTLVGLLLTAPDAAPPLLMGVPGAGVCPRLSTNVIASSTHIPTNIGMRSPTFAARSASTAASWGKRRPARPSSYVFVNFIIFHCLMICYGN